MLDFLINNRSIITKSVELIAALSGTYYLTKSRDNSARLFVIYLWITFFVEVIAMYASFIYYNDYDYVWFQAIKTHSVFSNNGWLYNMYSYFIVFVLGLYYIKLINNRSHILVIKLLIITYFVLSTMLLLFTDYLGTSEFLYFLEEVVIIVCILFYLFELLKSDGLLKFYNSIHFYIAVGLFVWYLCVMPIYIFGDLYKAANVNYVRYRSLVLILFNIVLYLCYTFGFYFSIYKKKQLA